jgi:hypothetical protein
MTIPPMPTSKTKLKNAAIAAKSTALPKIPKALFDQFVTRPIRLESESISLAFSLKHRCQPLCRQDGSSSKPKAFTGGLNAFRRHSTNVRNITVRELTTAMCGQLSTSRNGCFNCLNTCGLCGKAC